MDFGKLSKAIHTTKAKYNGNEFALQFRGISLKLQEELKKIGGIDEESDVIKLPEYLAIFVVSLTSGDDTHKPTLDDWKESDINFQSACFKAIQEAMNPDPKSTAGHSSDTLNTETNAASTSAS